MKKVYEEVDILYNLITYLNASYTQDMYYSVCFHILQNIELIPNIHIQELADLCYTSPATISRFCKALKCESFTQFKEQVQVGLKLAAKEIHMPAEELVKMHLQPERSIDVIIDNAIASLQKCKSSITIQQVDRLCDIIYDAKKLHFFGFQFNKIVASDIQLKLLKHGKFSYAFADRGDDAQRLEIVDKDSVAIVLSVRGRIQPIGTLIDAIKARGARVIFVTLNEKSEVIEKCDETFVVAGDEYNFSESSTIGTTTIKTFFDVLYVRYGILYPRG